MVGWKVVLDGLLDNRAWSYVDIRWPGDMYLQRWSCEPNKPKTERQLLYHLANMPYVKIVSQNLRVKMVLVRD